MFRRSSGERVWRQCFICDYVWQVSIAERTSTRAKGCKRCGVARRSKARTIAPSTQSLATLYPDISLSWDYRANGEISPHTLNPGSSTPRVWNCDKELGHPTWTTSPAARIRGYGCPLGGKTDAARNHRKPAEGRSLEELRPDIAELWHPTLNGNATPADTSADTTTDRYWRCAAFQDHVWRAPVRNLTLDPIAKCPRCNYGQSRIERTVMDGLSVYGFERNVRLHCADVKGGLRPDAINQTYSLVVEFDGWWYHRNSRERDMLRIEQYDALGFDVIRLRENSGPEKALPLLGQYDVQVPLGKMTNAATIIRIAQLQIGFVLGTTTRTHFSNEAARRYAQGGSPMPAAVSQRVGAR